MSSERELDRLKAFLPTLQGIFVILPAQTECLWASGGTQVKCIGMLARHAIQGCWLRTDPEIQTASCFALLLDRSVALAQKSARQRYKIQRYGIQ